MAAQDYPVGHPMAVKRWQSELMKQALKNTSFMQFMGRTSNSLVQIKTELEKDAGDRITFGLRVQLTGDGIAGDATLEGNEEALSVYTDNVFIDQIRHAVRSGGKMSEQRVPFSVRDEARDGLADWFANKFDTSFFNVLGGMSTVTDVRLTGMQAATAPDASHVVYAQAATGEASISSASVMSIGYIDILVERAKTLDNALRPIDIGRGQKKWVMFLHPYQVTDLRTNTSTGQWLDIQKAAMQGGSVSKNPIFTGALGEYNNVVLFENTRVPSPLTSVRRAILCGAQAAAWAFGAAKGSGDRYFDWTEELFDYKNQLGVAGATQYGLKKCVFNGSDFGTLVLSTWAAAH